MSNILNLDASLDDIIKSNKKSKAGKKDVNKGNQKRPIHKGAHEKRMGSAPRGKVPTAPKGMMANRRGISKSAPPKPLSRTIPRFNPADIVITSPRKPTSVQGRLGRGGSTQSSRQTEPRLSPAKAQSGFSIRGLAGPTPSQGDSGPCNVLICNLDPGANTNDVKVACSQFGTVLECEVFADHAGRSLGEAEVVFERRGSALDCIKKLDSQIVDGRLLRVTLRERPSSNSFPTLSIASQGLKSVLTNPRSGSMTSTRGGSGNMYMDSIPSNSSRGRQYY